MPNYFTIDGFEQLTQQQIFDMAVNHIGTTGVKSAKVSGQCLYSGSGCNAAPLLRGDSLRDADVAGAWMELVEGKDVPDNNAIFIAQLQDAHDSSGEGLDNTSFKSHYLIRMDDFAVKYMLDKSKLIELSLKWTE